MAANIPAKLKAADLTRFCVRAAQLETAKPVVAYWCKPLLDSSPDHSLLIKANIGLRTRSLQEVFTMVTTKLYSILQSLWTSSNGSKLIMRQTMLLWMIWLDKHTSNSLPQKHSTEQIGLSTQIRSQSMFDSQPAGRTR